MLTSVVATISSNVRHGVVSVQSLGVVGFTMKTITWSVLGSFSKGINGSVSINFGLSGGIHCDSGCAHHPEQNGTCYAAILERRHDRTQLKNKLARHESLPAWKVCGAALIELQTLESKGKAIPWVRISTDGSVPQPENCDKLFVRQFRTLMSWCARRNIPVHFPVESHAKAEFYRAIVGDSVTVRESLQIDGLHTTTHGAVSFTAGRHITSGSNIRDRRVAHAKELARERFKSTGRKTIVCPAITTSFRNRTKEGKSLGLPLAKCGSCTACANRNLDIVYPQH